MIHEEEEKEGEITTGMKTELVEKIRKLNNQLLTEMVTFVKNIQENAYFDPEGTGDRVQIKIHELSKENFFKLKDKVDNWQAGEPSAKR